jgi:predicted phosphodiesterase
MRAAVISDIHSNLPALEAVLAAVGSVDAVWQLGDVVGYGPDPDAVTARIREAGAVGVQGNHDAAAVGALSIEHFSEDARLAIEWTQARMSPETVAYLTGLPECLVPGDSDFTLVHGSPRDPIWEYLYDAAAARENLDSFSTARCLTGHTHIPRAMRETRGRLKARAVVSGSRVDLDGGRAFFNPGSVGQPRDGDPRASYMIVDTDARRVIWHRVEYDIESVQAAMVEGGLPLRLARRLSFGH